MKSKTVQEPRLETPRKEGIDDHSNPIKKMNPPVVPFKNASPG